MRLGLAIASVASHVPDVSTHTSLLGTVDYSAYGHLYEPAGNRSRPPTVRRGVTSVVSEPYKAPAAPKKLRSGEMASQIVGEMFESTPVADKVKAVLHTQCTLDQQILSSTCLRIENDYCDQAESVLTVGQLGTAGLPTVFRLAEMATRKGGYACLSAVDKWVAPFVRHVPGLLTYADAAAACLVAPEQSVRNPIAVVQHAVYSCRAPASDIWTTPGEHQADGILRQVSECIRALLDEHDHFADLPLVLVGDGFGREFSARLAAATELTGEVLDGPYPDYHLSAASPLVAIQSAIELAVERRSTLNAVVWTATPAGHAAAMLVRCHHDAARTTSQMTSGWTASNANRATPVAENKDMKRLLLLARGDGRAFTDLAGRSVVEDLPFPVTVFVDKKNTSFFEELAPNIDIEVVKWSRKEALMESAARLHQEHGLLGIAAVDERTVELAANMRATLGLPGLTPELTRNFRDKIVMKNKVRAAGLRVPDYVSCTDRDAVEALLAKHDRIVIKAVDGQGSREVTFVNSKDELDAWFATPNPYFENFEAEEFIDGILYHVNSIVHNGESILVASAPYLPNMGNIDFTEGTPFVSVLVTEGDLKARLEDFSQKALTALGLQNGVTHFECFVKSNGEIVFCETAVRPGGGGIVLMIEGQYGVNYNRAGILLEAGRGDLIKIEDRPNEVLGLMGIRQAFAGTVKKAPTSNLFGEEWIRHARIDAEVGNYVPSASHCTDFLGLFIFSSPSRNDFDTRREELYSRFYSSLEIQPGA